MICAIYARSATQNDDSIARQVAACRQKADELGMEVPARLVFVENGASGIGPAENRPSLKSLLAMATQPPPPFGLVIIRDFERLGRDFRAFEVIERLLSRGVQIQILQPLETLSSAAELRRNFDWSIRRALAYRASGVEPEERWAVSYVRVSSEVQEGEGFSMPEE